MINVQAIQMLQTIIRAEHTRLTYDAELEYHLRQVHELESFLQEDNNVR